MRKTFVVKFAFGLVSGLALILDYGLCYYGNEFVYQI